MQPTRRPTLNKCPLSPAVSLPPQANAHSFYERETLDETQHLTLSGVRHSCKSPSRAYISNPVSLLKTHRFGSLICTDFDDSTNDCVSINRNSHCGGRRKGWVEEADRFQPVPHLRVCARMAPTLVSVHFPFFSSRIVISRENAGRQPLFPVAICFT